MSGAGARCEVRRTACGAARMVSSPLFPVISTSSSASIIASSPRQVLEASLLVTSKQLMHAPQVALSRESKEGSVASASLASLDLT